MASRQRDPRAHPIDELFEAVDERVGLSAHEEALASRGVPDVNQRKLHTREGQARRRERERNRKPPMSTAEIVERATARARAKADVRANRSGEHG